MTTSTDTSTEARLAALAAFLDEDPDDWTEGYKEGLFECGRREYLVLTDEEADAEAAEYIEETLWAFNASFLVDYLPDGVGEEVIEALQPQCESANDAIRAMVGDRFGKLVEDAIAADGRGHFFSSYDGEENEAGDFYVYRMS